MSLEFDGAPPREDAIGAEWEWVKVKVRGERRSVQVRKVANDGGELCWNMRDREGGDILLFTVETKWGWSLDLISFLKLQFKISFPIPTDDGRWVAMEARASSNGVPQWQFIQRARSEEEVQAQVISCPMVLSFLEAAAANTNRAVREHALRLYEALRLMNRDERDSKAKFWVNSGLHCVDNTDVKGPTNTYRINIKVVRSGEFDGTYHIEVTKAPGGAERPGNESTILPVFTGHAVKGMPFYITKIDHFA